MLVNSVLWLLMWAAFGALMGWAGWGVFIPGLITGLVVAGFFILFYWVSVTGERLMDEIFGSNDPTKGT
jgi:hypothetical protein